MTHKVRTTTTHRCQNFYGWHLTTALIVSILTIWSKVDAQLDVFALPQAQHYAPKPTVPPEYKKYFELEDHARGLVESVIGPRPGGFFPPKSYEIGRPAQVAPPPDASNSALNEVERSLEQFLSAPSGYPQNLPPGFNQGFSVNSGSSSLSLPTTVRKHPTKEAKSEDEFDGSGDDGHSSIRGIPMVFPDLAKPPIDLIRPHMRRVSANELPKVPKFNIRPEVPDGGFGPNDIRRAPVSDHTNNALGDKADEYGALTDDSSPSGGLIGTIINLISMNKGQQAQPKNSAADLTKVVGNLLGGENSPIPGKNMISDVLYKALTSGSIQSNSSDVANMWNKTLTLTPAQHAAIGENLEMIQNLITQPSSPLCNPKPVPVDDFNVHAFMGQWYQVMYSPPLATGPCSMVAYKTLADVNDGGVGTIFEVFEYTTDGTPYVKPRISSGYAIVKQAGDLIFRTTSYQEDVNVHVLHVGPLNENGQYSYAILSTNCNYPLYVFSRDPAVYKERYESVVNQILEHKGLINGFSRLLNIVAPVDNSMCTFPPSLFDIHG